jgi:hypothetical protein
MSANQREAVTRDADAFKQKRTPVRTGAEYSGEPQQCCLSVPQGCSTTKCWARFVANLRDACVKSGAAMYLDRLTVFRLTARSSTDLSTDLSTGQVPNAGRAALKGANAAGRVLGRAVRHTIISVENSIA